MIRQATEFGGGRLDLLFNNAGAGFAGDFDQQTNEHWEKAFALNFYGAVYGIRAVLPVMRAQGEGHIVDIISGIAFYPMAHQTMYAATKAALNGLTLTLRYALWAENIRLTSATPGMTVTAIWGDRDAPPELSIPNFFHKDFPYVSVSFLSPKIQDFSDCHKTQNVLIRKSL